MNMGFLLIQSHQHPLHSVPSPFITRLNAARYTFNVLNGTKFKVPAIFFLFTEQSFVNLRDLDHNAGSMLVIDSHIHCGVQNVSQPFRGIQPLLSMADIERACLFAPVEDIYDRWFPDFDDNQMWRSTRQRAHEYLLKVARENPGIYPYYFVWNDFCIDDLDPAFAGIKWHHHAGEPEYLYEDPRCTKMIDAICERKLPIVLEETFETTLRFIKQVAGRTAVIIPHLGMLNGGYDRLESAEVWNDETVYADTALADRREILNFLGRHGSDRLLFGSDYPFGNPGPQFEALKRMGIDGEHLENICSKNILRLLP
jgi:hypothetical protein